jgi:hypothetical protein
MSIPKAHIEWAKLYNESSIEDLRQRLNKNLWYFLGACVLGGAGIMLLFLRNQHQDKGLLSVGQDEKEVILNPVSNDKVCSLDWKNVYRMVGY